MPIPRVITSARRSRPVYIDRDGETVSLVFEIRTGVFRVGRWTSIGLPARKTVFVIDSKGVKPVNWTGNRVSQAVRAFAVGMALASLLLIASRVRIRITA